MNYYLNYDTATGAIKTRFYVGTNDFSIANPPAGTANLAVSDTDAQLTMQTEGYTVVKGILTPPPALTSAQLLANAQAAQITLLQSNYSSAIIAPVSVTLASGVIATFASDTQTVTNLTEVLTANAKLATWKPNYWLDANCVVVTPVTYADLQAIAGAIQNMIVPDNQNLHAKIGQVIAATTVTAVQKIVF